MHVYMNKRHYRTIAIAKKKPVTPTPPSPTPKPLPKPSVLNLENLHLKEIHIP